MASKALPNPERPYTSFVTVPRFEVPVDHTYTLPYAVPICFGSVIAFFIFRA